MSRLAALAEEHWRAFLPAAYASINDREAFFRALAADAQSQIEDLEDALRGEDFEGETFAQKLGRYGMARSNAESQILREVLLLPAEADQDEDDDSDGELEQAVADFNAARDEFWALHAETGE